MSRFAKVSVLTNELELFNKTMDSRASRGLGTPKNKGTKARQKWQRNASKAKSAARKPAKA